MFCAKLISKGGALSLIVEPHSRSSTPFNQIQSKNPNQFREGHSRPVARFLALGKMVESKLSRTKVFLLALSSSCVLS